MGVTNIESLDFACPGDARAGQGDAAGEIVIDIKQYGPPGRCRIAHSQVLEIAPDRAQMRLCKVTHRVLA